MKISKIFVGVIYLYLLTMLAPIYLFYIEIDSDDIDCTNINISLFLFVISALLVLVTALISLISAVILYKKDKYIMLKKSMIAVKLWTIPFYIINFILCALICIAVTMGLRGMGIIFVPIPIAFTCTVIFLTGFYGVFYVKYLRHNISLEKPPTRIHYFLQLIPVLDIADTIYLLTKFKTAEAVE